ncbi:MAG: aspartate aminotransferase family protein [Gemmatimonadetes bacterium]|nr:aspartate aminotransferase family protein [Gemmatimonadota bacterium]
MNDLARFRRAAHDAVDWLADYLENLERYPVCPAVQPGEIRSRLPAHPPESAESWDALLADLDRVVLPGITHWQSPMFFGYFPANASGPAIIGDLISSGLGVQGMMWATSPAATELETHVLDWMVDLMGLPEHFRSTGSGGGVIQDTASSASLVALLVARERKTRFTTNRVGVKGTLTAYTSSQAHSSIEKAAGIAGIGRENLRLIDVDHTYAMRPGALDRAIQTDLPAGRTPFFVSATVGTTSSTAIDPVRAIGEICRRHGLWLHVDAAHAGSAAVCPEFRWIHDGLELADSYCFNPHKWLLTNFDCDCFYVADRAALIQTLSILPEYLRNQATESGAVFDYRDWGIPLGRRFRALKLWFVIRAYGAEGLRTHIRNGVALAQEFAGWVKADDRFELCAPRPLNLVCFRLKAGDGANERLRDALNASGKMYLIHTKLDGKLVLRLAIGGTYTERRHLERAWALITETAAGLPGVGSGVD